MANRPNGGPAFPGDIVEERLVGMAVQPVRAYPHSGMTLRDYFAAHCYEVTIVRDHDGNGEEDMDLAARDAYARADAMLRAREF